MRIRIAAVGRARRSPEGELCALYLNRIRTWPVELREIEPRSGITREAAAMRAAIPDRALIVALDRTGEMLDSTGLARRLDEWATAGTGHVVFLIGGADGLSDNLLADCNQILSFGSMTWPHMMARVMLAEQIYRAQQILAGHPYHRA